MTKVESELDEFGKRVLEPLRQSASIDPQILAEEKAKFLLIGENLSKNLIPGLSNTQSRQTDLKSYGVRRILSSPLFKAAAVILLVLILVGGSSFSVFASQDSLPGEPLYNIKAISEDIRLSLTFSTQEKLDLTLDYTNRRMSEIQNLVENGKTLPDQTTNRYQGELEDALELAAQLNDPQMQSALNQIRNQAENQGMSVEELIARLPAHASPAIAHLLERLREQVQMSMVGEQNPQAFRLQVRERAQNRHGPKHAPTYEQPGADDLLATTTPLSKPDHGNGNGMDKSTDAPGQDKPGNGQGQNNPGNGNRGPNPTQTP